MPAVRRTHLAVLVSVTALLVGVGGQAFGAGGHPSRPSPAAARAHGASAQIARLRAAAATEMQVALRAARSRGLATPMLRDAELSAIEPIVPDPGSLEGLESACSIEQGSASGSGGGQTTVSPSARARAVAGASVTTAAKSVVGELIPAGNLDGQPGTDVLDYRLTQSHQTLSAGVTARSGRTGAPLWSRTIPGAKDGFTIPIPDPDPVGTSRKPGVLLVTQSVVSQSSGAATVGLLVQAISGAGATLWTQTLTGQETITNNTETLTNLPILVGDIHDAPGGGHDLLVDVLNGTTKFSSGADSGTDQPEIISAATGNIVARGAAATSARGIPEALPVPDLNGDGLDDIAIAVGGAHGDIVAERGDTGTVIWTSSGVPVNEDADVAPIGFLSHAHTQDLVVTNENENSDSGKVSLIDGATGKLLWTHPGVCAYEIDKAGAHLRPAVGLVTALSSGGGSKSATARATFAARALHGALIFHRSVVAKVSVKKAARSESDSEELTPFGDVQPDGAQDFLVALAVKVGKHSAHTAGLVSGRDGALIKVPNGLPTAGSLRRGAGTDLVKATKASNTSKPITVSGYDAATGKLYYTQAIARTQGMRPELAYGVRVTGHHCSDLVVGADGARGFLIGLFDANAEPLWTVTAGAGRLTGGHVRVSKTPSQFCVA
jgi:hypothetical protein